MRTLFSFLLVFNSCFVFSQNVNQLEVTWLNPNPIKYNDGVIFTNNESLKLEFLIKTTQKEEDVKNHLRILVNGVDTKEGKKNLGVREIRKKSATASFLNRFIYPRTKISLK